MAVMTDTNLVQGLIDKIHTRAAGLGHIRLMEVCGTHTMEIGRLGLRALLPSNVELISGPGCPVCVTPASIIDAACDLARKKNHTILTFGDMVRVPGNHQSLEITKSKGGSIQTLLSPLQAINIAKNKPQETFIFISVGFETTLPVIARTLVLAAEENINNLLFLTAHRTVPNAISALTSDPSIQINGFILPGHVCSITGIEPFKKLFKEKLPAAVTGFEPLDILIGLASIIEMLVTKDYDIVNRYSRVVKDEGNILAQKLIASVFCEADGMWRGIGVIPGTALKLKSIYSRFDASVKYPISDELKEMPHGCSCGEVLKGKIRSPQCPLFGTVCTPETPKGPCMVSSEGSCAAYYKYGG